MKTLFVHQPFRFDILPACHPTIIPRPLLVLGACLRANDFAVKVHDLQIDRLPPDSIRQPMEEYRPDLVGLSLHAAPYIPATKYCCEAVKAANPDVPIVIGGIFTSSYKEKIFEVIPEIDIVVLNEAEETIVDLARALANGDSLDTVPGIIYKTGRNGSARTVTTPARAMQSELTNYPIPAYDLMEVKRYQQPGMLPPYIEAQRGCSYGCKFCGVHYPNRGRSVRYRNPESVVEEVEILHKDYGFERFFFSDDTFTINFDFVAQICEGMIDRGLNKVMGWTAYTRADRINSEIARLMNRAGCYSVAMGVETGSSRETESIGKGESVTDYKAGIKIIRDAGIDVHTLIIFGFPEVTHQDIPMAARFILDVKPTISQFFIFHPVPGTAFFEESDRHGLHYKFDKLEDWHKMDFIEEPVCDTKDLTKEEIIKYFIQYNLAFRSYQNLDEDPELQQRLLRNEIPRKKRDVVLVRTGKHSLYSSPVLPQGMTYADLHKNTRLLDEMQYEVLLRCNGDFTIDEIAERFAKLFDYSREDALAYVYAALREFERLEIIHQLPALKEVDNLLTIQASEGVHQVA